MSYKVKIYRQKRRSLMMRAVPGAIEVYIPHQLNENDRTVQQFIAKGLRKIGDDVPDLPAEKTSRRQILAMVEDYATRLKVNPTRVQFRDMRRKWGSCSSKGTVTLNTRLMWLEMPLAAYVVCHELAHLIELNHSKKFWELMAFHMPDYRVRMRELRQIEPALWS